MTSDELSLRDVGTETAEQLQLGITKGLVQTVTTCYNTEYERS